MPAKINIRCATSDHTVATVWLGSSLAVHRPIIDGKTSNLPKDWAISHLASGMAACRRFSGSKSAAVALARLWDESFGKIPASGSLNGWPHAAQWLNDLAIAQNGTSQPAGPVNRSPMDELQAATTPAQIQTALARAMGYEPMGDDDAAEPFPVAENLPRDRWRDGADGPEVRWRGRWWPVPTMGEVETWLLDSVAESPDGRTVEADAPDAWPVILGMM